MAKAKPKKPSKKKLAPAKKAPNKGAKAKPKKVKKAVAPAKSPKTKKAAPETKVKSISEKKPQKAAPVSATASKKQASSKEASKANAQPVKKQVPLGPIEPGRLGQKRNCLNCSTKFYDFERTPITCPKCFSEFEPEDFEPKIVLKSDPKKARAVEKEEEPEREIVVSDSSEFESLEDLSDDDSAVVGIGPDKDSDESFD